MPTIATVVYPYETKFDMSYYLQTHMPLVYEKWSQYGLTKWQVVEIKKTLGDAQPLYSVQALLEFNEADGLAEAVKSDAGVAVFDDVKNFSDKSPVFLAGSVVGSS